MTNTPNFWQTLTRPVVGLAPMNAITDQPFRHIQKKYGDPMVVYTEFTSVEGVCAGASRLLKDFLYDESQRPVVAQVFGHTPAYFRETAILLCQLGFDGIDINMGCPAPKVADRGSGAALICTPRLAQRIVRATQTGVREWLNGATVRDCPHIDDAIATEIEARQALLPVAFRRRRAVPVSIKTRIGYDQPDIDCWIPQLLECDPAAICIHGRTLRQGYHGKADWEEIGRAAALRSDAGSLILGNGDVMSRTDAQQRVADYGVDGVLIGRASYGNPFVFRADGRSAADFAPGVAELDVNSMGDLDLPIFAGEKYSILNVLLEHACLYETSFSHLAGYHISPMRKHFGWYVGGLPGARRLKRSLVRTSSVGGVAAILTDYLDYRLRRDGNLRRQMAAV